jgi:hypothetical protein
MLVMANVSSTGIAVVSVISLVTGYGLLWALWHFVFSPKRRHDDDLDRARRGEWLE